MQGNQNAWSGRRLFFLAGRSRRAVILKRRFVHFSCTNERDSTDFGSTWDVELGARCKVEVGAWMSRRRRAAWGLGLCLGAGLRLWLGPGLWSRLAAAAWPGFVEPACGLLGVLLGDGCLRAVAFLALGRMQQAPSDASGDWRGLLVFHYERRCFRLLIPEFLRAHLRPLLLRGRSYRPRYLSADRGSKSRPRWRLWPCRESRRLPRGF